MRRRRTVIAFTLAFGLCGVAGGTPTVSRTPTSGTAATVTLITSGPHAGKYDITLSNTQSGDPATFTIRGLSTENIRFITLNNTTSQTALIDVRGSLDEPASARRDRYGQQHRSEPTRGRLLGPSARSALTISSTRRIRRRTGGSVGTEAAGNGVTDKPADRWSLYGDVSALGGPINSLVVIGDIGAVRTRLSRPRRTSARSSAGTSTPTSTPNDRNRRLRVNSDFAGSLQQLQLCSQTSSTDSPAPSITGDCDAMIELAGGPTPGDDQRALTGSVTALPTPPATRSPSGASVRGEFGSKDSRAPRPRAADGQWADRRDVEVQEGRAAWKRRHQPERTERAGLGHDPHVRQPERRRRGSR